MQSKQQIHEQHSEGAAFIDTLGNDDSPPVARIVPATAGDRVAGHRSDGTTGEYSLWDEEPLREAYESGALSGIEGDPTKVVLGEGGENPHFPILEQVPPGNVIGQIERWEWDDELGGPVGYAPLADEEIAKRIDLGVLDVSADWLRFLGEYDEERDGRVVDDIVALPRVTVLDRGANTNASIEISPEMAEALGYVPDEMEDLLEQHASEGDAVRWQSDAGGEREPANERYGVVVNPSPDDAPGDWMVAVYQPTEDYDEWEARGETEPMSDDNLERVGPDGVDSLPPVSSVIEQDAGFIDRVAARVYGLFQKQDQDTGEQFSAPAVDIEQLLDEPAESGADGGTDDPPMDTDKLHDQLADARSRKKVLETQNEQLEEQLAAKNDRVDSLQERVDEKDSTVDELEEQLAEKKDRVEELEDELDQYEPLTEMLAGIVADGSMMSVEKVAEQHSAADLIDMIYDNAGDEEKSPLEVVQEQMAGGINARGQSAPSGGQGVGAAGGAGGSDGLSDEQLEEANAAARSLMGGAEVMQAAEENLSAVEYAARYLDVDPSTCNSTDEFEHKIKQAKAEKAGGEA